MLLEFCTAAEVKFGSLIWMSLICESALLGVSVLFNWCVWLLCFILPLLCSFEDPSFLPTPPFVNKTVYISGASSSLLHIQIQFLILSKWIPCEDDAYLKQSNEIKINQHFYWSAPVWLLGEYLCVWSKRLWFSIEPLGGCRVLLYRGRHNDLLVW